MDVKKRSSDKAAQKMIEQMAERGQAKCLGQARCSIAAVRLWQIRACAAEFALWDLVASPRNLR